MSHNFLQATQFYRRLIAAGNTPVGAAAVYDEAMVNGDGYRRCLQAVGRCDEPRRGAVIAEAMGHSLSVISAQLYHLTMMGLLVRTGLTQSYTYQLSEAGRAVLARWSRADVEPTRPAPHRRHPRASRTSRRPRTPQPQRGRERACLRCTQRFVYAWAGQRVCITCRRGRAPEQVTP